MDLFRAGTSEEDDGGCIRGLRKMFLGKEVRVFLKGQAKAEYIDLKKRTDKDSLTILRSVERMMNILKDNPQFGNPIRKDLIPESFKQQGITNLYRAELSNFWRLIYTLEGDRVDIFLFVLSIVDHGEYNKLFGY